MKSSASEPGLKVSNNWIVSLGSLVSLELLGIYFLLFFVCGAMGMFFLSDLFCFVFYLVGIFAGLDDLCTSLKCIPMRRIVT